MVTSFDAKLLRSKSHISAQHRLSLMFQKPLRGEMPGLGLLAHEGLIGDV